MGTVRYTVVDGEILSELRDGVKRDYVPDPLGSTVALLDSSQNITDTFSYWPYGESAGRTGTTPTPFQYVGSFGYYQDGAARSYVRYRIISFKFSRWLTEDPSNVISNDNNYYRYSSGNPLTFIDVSGLKGDPPRRGKKPPKNASIPVPGFWTCYTYACNCNGKAVAGNIGRYIGSFDSICNEVAQRAIGDKCVQNSPSGGCPPGWHQVVLYISDGPDVHRRDEHWVRKDVDGRFSDKHFIGAPHFPINNLDLHCKNNTPVKYAPYKRCPQSLCGKGNPLPPGRVYPK